MKKLLCATFEGINAHPVSVESTLTKGLPSFNIVGMANTAIKESMERVKSALLSNEFIFPPKRITINLSPSDLKKEGSQFDLGIALLIALDNTDLNLEDMYIFGELGLDGSVKENNLLYALILSLVNSANLTKAMVPKESLSRLKNIPNVTFIGVEHLNEAMEILKGTCEAKTYIEGEAIAYAHQEYHHQKYYYIQEYPLDFNEVKGQELAKRAALISASGMHNILLEGSPGSGKSMIAKRLQYILPPVSSDELLDIAKLDTLDGKEPHFKPQRPFRSPHHSSTLASVFGGGSQQAKIGEIGLAHNGILFFDELPHFQKNLLEALREPLEDKKIRISRVNSKIEYPTNFLFVAAMNPCPCGNLLSQEHSCRCSDLEISRYKNRLSEPFLDRIDLSIQMQPSHADETASFSSLELHNAVLFAHDKQRQREQPSLNGSLNDAEIENYCQLVPEASEALQLASTRFGLSFRAINKVKKVARTIADLDDCEVIHKKHILEALSYRRR